jgi:hypothetical protein
MWTNIGVDKIDKGPFHLGKSDKMSFFAKFISPLKGQRPATLL